MPDNDLRRTFVSPENGLTYTFNGSAWTLNPGQADTRQMGLIREYTPAQADSLMAQSFQAGQAAGGGGLTPSQLVNLTQNQTTMGEAGRMADEQSITDMEQEFSAIPDRLQTLYSNAAKRAGTHSDTTEFKAGLNSEVAAGSRGAQAALGSRLHALYSRLGRPVPQHLEQYNNSSAEQTVDNNVDNTQGVVDPDKGTAMADEPVSETPEAAAPADTQNAVAKVASPEELEIQRKRKMAAFSSFSG